MYSRNWHSVFIVTVVINLSLACQGHGRQEKKKQTDDEPKALVLVPIVDLPSYHLFKDSKQFTLMEWPKSRLREDVSETITSFDQVKGKTSRHYKLRANEPFYKNDLADSRDEVDNGHGPQNGQVAHAIILRSDKHPVGVFKPGQRVDIMATLNPQVPGEAIKTMFFLEDIEVLDVDKATRDDGIGGNKYRMLLRLTGPQALALKYFEDTAKLDAVLRKPGDPTRVRHQFSLTPEITTSSLPYDTKPEQKLLNQWIGHWRASYQQEKLEGTPEAKSGTAEIEVGSVMKGKFVQESGYYSDGTINRLLFHYDEGKKQYRGWWFSSTRQTEESTGKWDPEQKTMTWSSTGNPDVTTIVKHHFKDKDTIEFDVITKDRSGKLLFNMTGKRSRVKAATK